MLGIPAVSEYMHACAGAGIGYSCISSFTLLRKTDFDFQGQADKTRAREQVHTAAISALIARPCLSALPPFQCVKPGA